MEELRCLRTLHVVSLQVLARHTEPSMVAGMRGHASTQHMLRRTKVAVDGKLSDRELFAAMPMGDTWDESQITSVFFYLLDASTTDIPDSWYDCMYSFARELRDAVGGSAEAVAAYNEACSLQGQPSS